MAIRRVTPWRGGTCIIALLGACALGGGSAAAAVVKPKATIRSHKGEVWALAFSPDGKMLASGDDDGVVQLWTADGKRRLTALKTDRSKIRDLAFNPKLPILAAGRGSGLVELISLRTGRAMGVAGRHASWVRCVVFSSDGKMILSGGNDVRAYLRDLKKGKPVAVFHRPDSQFEDMAFSPDGKLIAMCIARRRPEGGWGGAMELWDPSTGKLSRTLMAKSAHVNSVAFSPDGRRLFYGFEKGIALVWDLSRTEPGAKHERVLAGHDLGVDSVMVSDDSKRLMTGGNEGRAIAWDVETGRELARVDTLSGMTLKLVLSEENYSRHRMDCVFATAFSPDGRTFATGSGDGTVRLFDLPKEFAVGAGK